MWHDTPAGGASAQEYLVDSTGTAQYLVDPVINGTHKFLANGKAAPKKFDAPKATLMSYIIKGILNHKLPWGLVLLGVMLAGMLAALDTLAADVESGAYVPAESDEDVHGSLERGLIEDATVATSESQADAFWRIRDSISEAERATQS